MDDEKGLIGGTNGKYTVVARRYRPKSFDELVGQGTVSQALSTAIRSGRVGHAYLFTGARGVGKTSTARIFAKALNAPGGPNPSPELDSDVAQAIDAGEDMDVIEIDGASNRGIEEIRQLRANVNVRPSRSRYKIYIIDEVHMLTTQAFNALLKTLEEPPEHVKFIFCTTDPEKIPITVLSRCQRFDFSPVKTDAILDRLKFICESEHAVAEDEALRVIARRAAGSMRDSQSLLEQILSFSAGSITVQQVHEVLGTADETLLAETAQLLMNRDAAGVLRKLDESVASGVDAGQFGEQLLGYLRDLMVVAVGGSSDLLTTANPNSAAELSALGQSWGVTTLLSALQLLDEALVKMRHSIQSRILLEVALIQICQLQDLQKLSDLIAYLDTHATPSVPKATVATPVAPASEKKNVEAVVSPTPSRPSGATFRIDPPVATTAQPPNSPTPHSQSVRPPSASSAPAKQASDNATFVAPPESLNATPVATKILEATATAQATVSPNVSTSANASASSNASASPSDVSSSDLWQRALERIDGFIGDYARMAIRLETSDPKTWKLVFPAGSELALEFLENPDNRRQLVEAIQTTANRSVQLALVQSQEAPLAMTPSSPSVKGTSSSQRMREASENPYIQRICKELEGEIIRVDPPVAAKNAVPAPHGKTLEGAKS